MEKEEIKNLIKSQIPTITMYRLNVYGKRVYVNPAPFKVYSGLTGALSAATFKGNVDSKRLVKWRDKMVEHLGGQAKQEAYLESMANFGTLVHQAIVRIWNEGKLNWKFEQEYATDFFRQSMIDNNIEINELVIKQQVFEYCKNAASLMAFLHAEVTELYAVEAMAKSDQLEIATPIDIFCKLKSNLNATINIKTSAQISDHHREQVAMEKHLWNNTYNNAHVTGILRPKDWAIKKVPTYEFEILNTEDDRKLAESAIKRLLICKSDESSTYLSWTREHAVFQGETKMGEMPKIEIQTLEQIFNQNQ